MLNPNRSRNINIAMTRLPATRYLKPAIMNMDTAHLTREGIEVGHVWSGEKSMTGRERGEEGNRVKEAEERMNV